MRLASLAREGVLALCAAWLLLGSTASADQILIAKHPTLNRVALYTKTTAGCAEPSLPGWVSGPHVNIQGTSQADVIVVFDSGAPLTWCGHTIQPIGANGQDVSIFGMEGADIIWGGNGGGVRVSTIDGSNPWAVPADTTGDWVFGGPGSRLLAGEGADIVMVKNSNAFVGTRGGTDLICTQVPGAYFIMSVRSIDGGNQTDARYGVAGTTELSIERPNDESDGQRCSYAYAAVVSAVLGMLNG